MPSLQWGLAEVSWWQAGGEWSEKGERFSFLWNAILLSHSQLSNAILFILYFNIYFMCLTGVLENQKRRQTLGTGGMGGYELLYGC